jgi:hypothetical protein
MSTISKDGFLIDEETGEVLGHVELTQMEDAFKEVAPAAPFVIDTPAKVDWVLEKLQTLDADLAAVEARRAAINANLDTQADALRKRRAWTEMRFAADLRMFAAAVLAGSKLRTYTSPFGKLSFRKTAGAITILFPEDALAWCKENCPEAIVVKESVIKTPLKAIESELPPAIFEVTAPGEAFKIETGVKAEVN